MANPAGEPSGYKRSVFALLGLRFVRFRDVNGDFAAQLPWLRSITCTVITGNFKIRRTCQLGIRFTRALPNALLGVLSRWLAHTHHQSSAPGQLSTPSTPLSLGPFPRDPPCLIKPYRSVPASSQAPQAPGSPQIPERAPGFGTSAVSSNPSQRSPTS
ncbi:hypothetical protein BaRGS_00002500 [Batillaria attramentaria]|uniref:Uncharacterized protein n=1 Tax=Batillaria attramentaria TaxID=370345 RepID=A0ABD0M5E8_9CAEN